MSNIGLATEEHYLKGVADNFDCKSEMDSKQIDELSDSHHLLVYESDTPFFNDCNNKINLPSPSKFLRNKFAVNLSQDFRPLLPYLVNYNTHLLSDS